MVPLGIEARLNECQKKRVALLVQGERLTSRRCEAVFKITCDTATPDFSLLMKLGLARREGKGRATYYVLVAKTQSSENRQTDSPNRQVPPGA